MDNTQVRDATEDRQHGGYSSLSRGPLGSLETQWGMSCTGGMDTSLQGTLVCASLIYLGKRNITRKRR